jgi:hypothetical protein
MSQVEPNGANDSSLDSLLGLKEIPPQVEVWQYTHVYLADVDEGGDNNN